MSVESAEMTKHAINAFLATSVTFANEVATLCERVGADAKEVERGLRTERRIGALAYVAPGGAFAGGTLARDAAFLRQLGTSTDRPTPLMDGVLASNSAHRLWAGGWRAAAVAGSGDAGGSGANCVLLGGRSAPSWASLTNRELAPWGQRRAARCAGGSSERERTCTFTTRR